MLAGKRLRLKRETLAVQSSFSDTEETIRLPAGSTITVLGSPRKNDPSLMDILWNSIPLVVFVKDIEDQGEA